jgi:glycosyltransferase involved in cell wall biosynthesis
MKRVLFIGHEATRSGAPMILLRFLQWLRENDSRFEADLLLLRGGGDLEEEYRKVVNLYVLPQSEKPHIFRRGVNFLKKKLKLAPKLPNLLPFTRHYDAVLGNTVISLEYLKLFREKGFPTVCWLHELDYAIGLYSKKKFIELANYVDRFLVVSRAVEDMLKRYGIKRKTHLVYGFASVDLPPVTEAEIQAVKNEIGISRKNAFIIGASGTIEWRKGADVFLQIAHRLASEYEDFYFVWVGGRSPYSSAEYDRIQYDFERLDLKGKVIFTGIQADPYKFFAAMDLFALTSREDPFPLVCLEAAGSGKPTICFDRAGGMPEFTFMKIGMRCEKPVNPRARK